MRNISDKSDISDMFDMSDMFEKNPKCIIEQNSQNNNIINSVPDCLPHYSESNERNQSMSLQNEQKYTEESNKGDNTPIQTISAIPEKKDDSESFDDLEDFLVSKDNFVNKEFLGKKRDKSKSKENKVTKNKLFKVIHLENFENEEENNKEFISAAEKVTVSAVIEIFAPDSPEPKPALCQSEEDPLIRVAVTKSISEVFVISSPTEPVPVCLGFGLKLFV